MANTYARTWNFFSFSNKIEVRYLYATNARSSEEGTRPLLKYTDSLLYDSSGSRDPTTSDSLPNLPLEVAATKNLLTVVEYLLDAKDAADQQADPCAESGIHGTALRAAIASRHEGVANCLITHQASKWGIRKRSVIGLNNIQHATGSRDEQAILDSIILESSGPKEDFLWDSESTLKRQVETRAEAICRDADYGNILHLATFQGLKSTISLLLEYGADPNVPDTSQRTPLHIASWFGFPEIVDLLMDYQADVTVRDEWGATPLDQVEESLNRDGSPGASEADLVCIREQLRDKMGTISKDKPRMVFISRSEEDAIWF
jgi:hypothetical protein